MKISRSSLFRVAREGSSSSHFLRRIVAMGLLVGSSVSAQISLTGPYSEDFDAALAGGATVFPAGWSAVSASNPTTAVGTSDDVWAGRQSDLGFFWAYNAALQTDVTQNGDGTADRGISIYATDGVTNRYIQATFTNDTGGTITSLDVDFNVVLYAARFDSTSANVRWDGLRLAYDAGAGLVTTGFEAKFQNSEVTFGAEGSPWTAGSGWATSAMIPGGNKKAVAATIPGLSIAPGETFTLRWISRQDSIEPTAGTGSHWNMNVGVDDVVITPTVETSVDLEPLTVSIVNDGGMDYLAVTYDQPTGGTGTTGVDYEAGGMSYVVESNVDLGAVWDSGPSGGGYLQVVPFGPPVDNGDGTETVTVRMGKPISDEVRLFARLSVSPVAVIGN